MRGLQRGEAHEQDPGPTGLFHQCEREKHLHRGSGVARTSFSGESPTTQARVKADHQQRQADFMDGIMSMHTGEVRGFKAYAPSIRKRIQDDISIFWKES